MILRPPRSTRTDTLFPYTTLFRSVGAFVLQLIGAYLVNQPNTTPFLTQIQQGAPPLGGNRLHGGLQLRAAIATRSEEHTSELQSLMRNSYAVFCLKKKKKIT